jgi:hypothetical protein
MVGVSPLHLSRGLLGLATTTRCIKQRDRGRQNWMGGPAERVCIAGNRDSFCCYALGRVHTSVVY